MTGASGYVGSRAIASLVEMGWSVRALVRRHRPYIATEQVVVDITGEMDPLRLAVAGCDAVLHLAGANEVVAAEDPDAAVRDTIVGARHVAAAAADEGVARLVYVSTVHVYGAALVEGAVVSESTVPAPTGIYGLTRLASEHLLSAHAAQTGSEAVILRLTNAVGAPVAPEVDRWSLVGNDLCRQAVRDGRLVLRSPGLQWRDFIALADVVALVGSALTPGGLPGGTYNLGSGTPMTILDLAALVQDAIEEHTGSRPPLDAPVATGVRPDAYHVDIGRLAALGWKPDSTVAAAVSETARFCLQNRSAM